MALALTGGVSAGEPEWHFDFTDPVSNKLVWQSNTGINYNVTHSANLSTWLPDDGFPKAGTGGWMELSFVAVSNGFFKIISEAAVPGEFVLIPAGGIQVGDTFGDGATDERPVFTLYNIDAFSIGRYEVTKSLWDDVRTWSINNGYTNLPAGAAKAPNHPVGSVSWHAVVKWCNARSEKEGLTPCYTVNGAVYRNGETKSPLCNRASNGYRLPTEVEWEKAARGGSAGHRFPWTDTDEITHNRANYNSTGAYPYDTSPTRGYHPTYYDVAFPYTNPVGAFPPNGYGLCDMAGNVYEWCGDWYDIYPSNQGGPVSGTYRLYRGGGWGADARAARCSKRNALSPSSTSLSLGFRLVRGQP